MGDYEIRQGLVIFGRTYEDKNDLTYDLIKVKETKLSLERLTSRSLI